jgi:hypothetical protein
MFTEFQIFERSLRVLAGDETIDASIHGCTGFDIAGNMATRQHIIYQQKLTIDSMEEIMQNLSIKDFAIREKITQSLSRALPQRELQEVSTW